MNLVDSSAWLEYFADTPLANHFTAPLTNPEALVVPTVVLYEVLKVVERETGENAALQVRAVMQKSIISTLDADLAAEAAGLSLKHGLPMADAIILATANKHEATIWTLDAHFKQLPGVKYFKKQR
ncbi:MAG: type II toxin-antitoxin system VapC family toxin [Lentisphaerae bacterium]|jgi:predicted nucleic acid-binding protein|nr:type II toxin-antitoxin system VapC family toxin [Lentisphaerota bacterium]